MALTSLLATIPAGQSVSNAVDCSSGRVVRIIMPPSWTGAASLTFCTSPDNTTFHDLYHTTAETYATNEVIIPAVTPNSAVVMPAGSGDSFNWVKLRSGGHATPVVQAADRVFQIIVNVADTTAGGVAGPTGPAGPAGVAGPVGPAGVPGTVTSGPLLQVVVLGHAKGVDFNALGDTPIAINSARYVVYQLLSFNNVGGQDNYNGSLRDAAGGLGNDLGFYVYNQDGQAGYWIGAVGGVAPILTTPTLYFHIGTKENAPATGDLYVMGYDLTGL
jgi:hypothetical protein